MIYDCFTFFNELDVLELRLNELDAVVDRFVLVEATLNHQGKAKPLYFEENKKRFEKFLPKIIHVVVNEYPPNPSGNSWVWEHHQRNMIMEGIRDARHDDVIMISDVDEMPRPSAVTKAAGMKGMRIFRQRMFYYYLNCMNVTNYVGGKMQYSWNGTIMVNKSDIRQIQEFRELSMQLMSLFQESFLDRMYWTLRLGFKIMTRPYKVSFMPDAGWHFSYLGGVQRIISKLEAFAHDEYNREEFKDPRKIEDAIRNGKDILGRDFKYCRVELDDSFPSWFLSHREAYAHLVL